METLGKITTHFCQGLVFGFWGVIIVGLVSQSLKTGLWWGLGLTIVFSIFWAAVLSNDRGPIAEPWITRQYKEQGKSDSQED